MAQLTLNPFAIFAFLIYCEIFTLQIEARPGRNFPIQSNSSEQISGKFKIPNAYAA